MTLRFRAAARARGATLAAALMLLAAANAGAAERYWPPIVDPPTSSHTPGRWVWADLATADVARAAEFYAGVFGWTFETYGGDDDRETYTLVLADGVPIGGLVFDARAMRGEEPSARWIGFASVRDPAATAAKVTSHGGKVVFGPEPLGERGTTAVFRDPSGALFGVVHSRNGDPADYLGDVGEWVWLDLWTDDVSTSTGFYQEVLGYASVPANDDGVAAREGVHLVSGDRVRAGIMPRRDGQSGATWLPYVRVSDAARALEAARAGGGKVIFGPAEVGRASVGIVADPTGAPIGIVQLRDTAEARP